MSSKSKTVLGFSRGCAIAAAFVLCSLPLLLIKIMKSGL